MRFRQRARDLAIEVLIAVVLVTAYVIYQFKFPKGPRPDSWIIGLSVNTIIVVGFLASWFKHQRKNAQFWLVLGLLLFCHMALFIFFLRRIERVQN
jgi:drug/metabolite transporter (DMT)-like permease